MAVGLALIVRIYEKYGSIEEDEIKEVDRKDLIEEEKSNKHQNLN